MTMRGSSFVKGNLVEDLQSNSHLSLMVKRSFHMRLSNKFMVGAGMAIVLTLPFSHAAMSAPTDPVSSPARRSAADYIKAISLSYAPADH
jgi:hypothetical protein